MKVATKSEREAALMTLESAVRGNTDGQILLVSTLAPTGLGGFDDGNNQNEEDDDEFSGETSLGGLFARAMLRATSTSSTSSSHGGGFISEDEKKRTLHRKLREYRLR